MPDPPLRALAEAAKAKTTDRVADLILAVMVGVNWAMSGVDMHRGNETMAWGELAFACVFGFALGVRILTRWLRVLGKVE